MPVREAKQLFHELVEEFSVEGNPDFEQAVESMQSVLSNLRLSLTRTRNAARTEDILSLVMDVRAPAAPAARPGPASNGTCFHPRPVGRATGAGGRHFQGRHRAAPGVRPPPGPTAPPRLPGPAN